MELSSDADRLPLQFFFGASDKPGRLFRLRLFTGTRHIGLVMVSYFKACAQCICEQAERSTRSSASGHSVVLRKALRELKKPMQGRKPYDKIFMFLILVLQNIYNL
jgi:hypothetical protein